jgi:hypothetical protein
MGHHFDSPTSLEDPRIDPTDFFIFPGTGGDSTVFVLNVNPDAGINVAAQFRPEALYEIRIAFAGDRNSDVTEELALQAMFGPAGPSNEQAMTISVARGAGAAATAPGNTVGQGVTEGVLPLTCGGRAWAGHASDPFTANFFGHSAFIGKLMGEGVFQPEVFTDTSLHEGHPANSFTERNVLSLVFEVPNTLLDQSTSLEAWAVVSLYGHAPTIQVARMGHPVIVFYFGAAKDPGKLTWLQGHPRDDRAVFGEHAAGFVAKAAAAAGRTADPAGYGRLVADLFLPDVLSYQLGTTASYGMAGRNGRALTDDVLDVQLSTLTNAPVNVGIDNLRRVRGEFPYVGEPWPTSHSESLYDATH